MASGLCILNHNNQIWPHCASKPATYTVGFFDFDNYCALLTVQSVLPGPERLYMAVWKVCPDFIRSICASARVPPS